MRGADPVEMMAFVKVYERHQRRVNAIRDGVQGVSR